MSMSDFYQALEGQQTDMNSYQALRAFTAAEVESAEPPQLPGWENWPNARDSES